MSALDLLAKLFLALVFRNLSSISTYFSLNAVKNIRKSRFYVPLYYLVK